MTLLVFKGPYSNPNYSFALNIFVESLWILICLLCQMRTNCISKKQTSIFVWKLLALNLKYIVIWSIFHLEILLTIKLSA